MNIDGSTALVTGANRGLGRAYAQALLDRGARKVYAAARRPETIDLPGVHPIELDVTDPEQARRAAAQASDVTLLINNAGISTGQDLIAGDLDQIRLDLETNLFGTLNVTRAFVPALTATSGDSAIVNVLSAMSWFAHAGANSYHVAKAAAWALTNGIRLELASKGTLVTGVHLGLADTDMAAGFDADKLPPADVARATLDGVEAGAWEVLVDDWSRFVKSSLVGDPQAFYAELATAL
jgi:NAD(P)-dependent dehydrogenase (short-subunit alcohol dehydrogenase family)